MAEYQMFPDIKLITGRHDNTSEMSATEISFCISGVCEYSVEQKYYYLKAGNCIILQSGCETGIAYSSDYCGITLLIDPQFKSIAFSDILDIQGIMKKMSHGDRCIFSADEKTEKLFSDIYEELVSISLKLQRNKIIFKNQICLYIITNLILHY